MEADSKEGSLRNFSKRAYTLPPATALRGKPQSPSCRSCNGPDEKEGVEILSDATSKEIAQVVKMDTERLGQKSSKTLGSRSSDLGHTQYALPKMATLFSLPKSQKES